jgi:hypothetical protein
MNTAIVLVLAVVCFFIGIIAAYLFQSLREESKPALETPAMQDGGEIEEEPYTGPARFSPLPAAGDKQESEAEISKPPPPGMIEVARFWRDENSPKNALEMDGNLYHRADELSPEQLVKLEVALRELATWIGKPFQQTAPLIESGAFLTDQVNEPSGFKPPKMGPLDILKNTLDADVRAALKSAPKSLAAQVDEILQARLAGSDLEERGIRIMDTPSSDLVVMVGLEKYDGVDAVPDVEIQAVIREAVAEWARRSTLEGGATS